MIRDTQDQRNKMIHKMIIMHIETIKKAKTVDNVKEKEKS